MKRRLDALVDRGCWISHDRVYAFVSADHGITELGFHGKQPVSKNSRVLSHESGVLAFSIGDSSQRINLQTSDVDWQASQVDAATELDDGTCTISIEIAGRRLVVRCSLLKGKGQTVFFTLSKNAFFTGVHGTRTWNSCRIEGSSLLTSFHDTIMLQSWMKRTGPYAGDFLIPEPIRREIFATSKRSGLATREDLREQYRFTDIPLYDARVGLKFGGEGLSVHEEPHGWIFGRSLIPGESVQFVIECQDAEAPLPAPSHTSPPAEHSDHHHTNPRLTLEGFPRLREFVETVQSLVDSCIVHDYGIPRACPGRYYWIWAWDSLVTMAEALRWGDSTNASRTLKFIEDHRDDNGHIPARWTRSLLPLDTPSAGGIEFLQASLVYETLLETGDRSSAMLCLPSFVTVFEEIENDLLRRGYTTGEGFYPDLLTAFGRTEHSSVCMELGSRYVFCQLLRNLAHEFGDPALAKRAAAASSSIAGKFDELFWDENKGFFIDAVNVSAGGRGHLHPLFNLLFLQSPLGLSLVRAHLDKIGSFVAAELMTDAGVRCLPLGEAGIGGEAILDSWYPHWDLYALKVMRRTGDAESIRRWLTCAERALEKLGYCPEFLALKGFREGDQSAWEHHGSASNLNCATSWIRGLRESVAGYEFDPGGITHLPLSLPIPRVAMDDVRWRGGTWSLESDYSGAYFQHIIVDDAIIEGTSKVPYRFHTPGEHVVQAIYSNEPSPPCFTEVTNGMVVSSRRKDDEVEVSIEPLGPVDGAFFSPHLPEILADNVQIPSRWNPNTGRGFFTLPTIAPCTLRMRTI